MNNVTNRYIFMELLPPFLINVGFLLFIFLMTKILDITNYIVNYKIGLTVVLSMLFFSMPQFLQFVIPMSVMLAVLLTFLRMSGDNEITALKASGFSIYQLLPPVVLFCVIGTLLTMFLTIYGIPWGNLSLRGLTARVAASSFEIGLKERTFNDNFKDVMLYVSKIDAGSKELMDVFIEDKRGEDMINTIVSSRGKLISDSENLSFRLRLWDGTINQVDIKNRSVNSIQFETYDVRLSIKELIQGAGDRRKNRREMSLGEMRDFMKTSEKKDRAYNKTLLDYHKKFSIPLASVVLGLIAVPLGIQSEVRKRSSGLAFGLALFLMYYILLTTGTGLGKSGKLPPLLGMWAPNLVMGIIAAIFIFRAGRERPLWADSLKRAASHFFGTLIKRRDQKE
ncbi:MAG: LPS export ABC transporter permease LptF [Deltaproteobacteria bacterium]|nr:MAG: LPS export ABC transporter permease LptF [Deltaproteobacteria bacterium]